MINMTSERLAEIEDRCNSASEAPWFCALKRKVGCFSSHIVHSQTGSEVCQFPKTPSFRVASDASFIAHARQDIPDLIAEIKSLKEMVASYETERDGFISMFDGDCPMEFDNEASDFLDCGSDGNCYNHTPERVRKCWIQWAKLEAKRNSELVEFIGGDDNE